jgi:hypothetical protein
MPEAQDIDLGLALDSYDTLDIARMDVFVPGGIRPIGWIEFCGPGHPKAVQLSNEAQRRGLHEARDRAIKGTRWKPPERTPDQVNEETQKWVVDRIVDWSIKATAMGEGGNTIVVDVPFTHATAMKLFGDPKKGWLLNAAAEFMTAIENFMPSSSAS